MADAVAEIMPDDRLSAPSVSSPVIESLAVTSEQDLFEDMPLEEDASEWEHIGQELRRAREAANLSLQDIATQLHISASYLTAIEELNKDALPSLGYVLGFMRSYAKFLNLDVVDAVARYKVDSEIPHNLGMRGSPHFVAQRRLQLPKGSISAMMVIGSLAMLASWYGMTSPADAAAPVVATSAPLPALGLAAPMPTQGNAQIVSIQASSATWVQISDGKGNIVTSRIFVPGELFEVKISDDYILAARDGGALTLYRGGKLVGPIAVKGQSIQGLSLR